MITDQYHESFEQAQAAFDGRLDDLDRSSLVVVNGRSADITSAGPDRTGFYPIDISLRPGSNDLAVFAGRAILVPNTNLGALSPAVITAEADQAGGYQITMLQQPYTPNVGFSEGMHFGLSAKVQTRTAGFGGHGTAGGFEQGHMGAVLLGARDGAIGRELVVNGDTATHRVLNAGTAESFSQYDMLNINYVTRPLPANTDATLRVYWHETLPDVAGDFPEATKLLLGAGIRVLGTQGLDRARRLVDDAIRGAH